MLKYFFAVFKVGFKLVFANLFYLRKYAKNPNKYSFEKRFNKIQKLCKSILKTFNIVQYNYYLDKYYISRELDKNYLLICNHQSDLDAIWFLANAEYPLTVIAKKEAEKYPIIGNAIKALEGEFLDRNDLKQQLKTFLNIQRKLENVSIKRDVLIFPEGTRNRNPKNSGILPYKAGALRCAFKTKSPIATFSIFGTFRGLSTKYKNRFNPVEFSYLKTYFVNEYNSIDTEELTKIIEKDTEKELNKQKIENHKHMCLLNKRYHD